MLRNEDDHEYDEEEVEWVVSSEQAGERIDRFLTEQFGANSSRSQIQGWIADEHITVNGTTVKSNYKIKSGDVIVFNRPAPVIEEIVAEDIPLDIVYEDRDVIVVNKPRGMVVHPALGHRTGTLVNALLYHCAELSIIPGEDGAARPGIVHRLDKDTSGLMMVAKNDVALRRLAKQLKKREVLRKYVAIVHGALQHQVGTIDAPIGRDPHDRKLFTVRASNSKEAITHFTVLEVFQDYTLLELKLETGRTHQIRVHLKFIDHPVVGDPAYGRSKGLTMDGQALHAMTLGFTHPSTGEYLEFHAPIPDDMEALLQLIKSR